MEHPAEKGTWASWTSNDSRTIPAGASREFGKDGVLVRVLSSQGNEWMGVFAFGTSFPSAVTGVYHMPQENRFCVVSRGKADSVAVRRW